jgi:hypothetical protein
MSNMDPKYAWESSIFFEKKVDWVKGRQGENEAGSTFVLLSIRTQC